VSGFGQGSPDYGSGVFRRRVRLENRPRQVTAELEDINHGFRLTLSHDGQRVTDIAAEPIRYPFDTCPGAVAMLKPLVGCALDSESSALRRTLPPGQNCTHLYDLALLALAHSARPARDRIYDVTVPDEIEDGALVTLNCDGVAVHEWRVRSHHLVEPPLLAGNPMQKGFYRWASEEFSGDSLEAAQVLQRGYFVAQSRRYDYMNSGGRLAKNDNMPDGACYSYNTGVVEQAVHTAGMARDFTDAADQLLKFV
jgi:hypothetical protein